MVLLLILGAFIAVTQITSSRSQNQDVRSRAAEEIKYPQSVRCLNQNLPCEITGSTPANTVVGLYATNAASCATKKYCDLIDNTYVTSCAVYDFGKPNTGPIIVKYTQTKQSIARDSCSGEYCGTFSGFQMFTSNDNQTWKHAASPPGTSADIYREQEIKPDRIFRYVMACRGRGGPARDNIKIEKIYLVGAAQTSTPTPMPSSQPTPTPVSNPPSSLVNKKMVFAEKYRRTTNGEVNELAYSGYYEFLANGVAKIHATIFNRKNSTAPTASSHKHGPMNAPYWDGCTPGPIYKPTAESNNELTGSWEVNGDILKVRMGTVIHEWRLMDPISSYYRINKDLTSGGTTVYSETDGFGYLTDSVSSEKIYKNNLLDYYFGEFMENNGTLTSPWIHFQVSLSTTVFKATADPNVITYSHAAPYAGHPNTWSISSLLFNDAPSSNLIIFTNGGHDFNENGCLDLSESGHSYQCFGVKERNKITKMVCIEYSDNDAYPFLGILRYYQKNASDVSIKLKNTPIPALTKGQTYTLAWESANTPTGAYVGNIQLSKGPQIYSELIQTNKPATGSFQWSLPTNLPSDNYYSVNLILYVDFPGGRTRVPVTSVRSANFSIH